MTEITLQVSNSLATKIQSFGAWSATVFELNFAEFKSAAVKSATDELIEFLSRNPSPPEVAAYYVSDENQAQLDYLLDLNAESQIEKAQSEELFEWRKFNHLCVMLKAQAAKLLKLR